MSRPWGRRVAQAAVPWAFCQLPPTKASFTAETNCVISGCLISVSYSSLSPPACAYWLAHPATSLWAWPNTHAGPAGWGLSESLAHRMSLRGYGSCWTPPARADLRSRGLLAHSFQSHSGRVALGGLPAGSATSGGFQEDRGAREPTLDDQALSHLGEPGSKDSVVALLHKDNGSVASDHRRVSCSLVTFPIACHII